MSLNIIIIAAIVLIVLVVLWAIFTGRMGIFSKGLQKQDSSLQCGSDAINGVVVPSSTCPAGQTPIPGTFGDVLSGSVCCTKAA